MEMVYKVFTEFRETMSRAGLEPVGLGAGGNRKAVDRLNGDLTTNSKGEGPHISKQCFDTSWWPTVQLHLTLCPCSWHQIPQVREVLGPTGCLPTPCCRCLSQVQIVGHLLQTLGLINSPEQLTELRNPMCFLTRLPIPSQIHS